MSAKSFSGRLIPDPETFFQSFLQAESFILGAELRIGVTAYIYDELDTELAKKSFELIGGSANFFGRPVMDPDPTSIVPTFHPGEKL